MSSDFSRQFLIQYKDTISNHKITPMEFVLLHILAANTQTKENGVIISQPITAAYMIKKSKMSRETIRRNFLQLQKKGLIKKITGGWILA